jgi:hypothetical protein
MLFQHVLEDITKTIIVFETPDLGDHTGLLERFVVQFVY